MRMYFVAAIAAAICMPLAACSGEHIDSRQIDWNNGLAYEHGETKPFTGTVDWTTEVPTFLKVYYGNQTVEGAVTAPISACETQLANGDYNGFVSCTGPSGKTTLELTLKNGNVLDGDAKKYNADTGALFSLEHYENGKLNGVSKVYTKDGKQLLFQKTWANGIQEGPAKTWTADGTLTEDLVMKNGRPFSGDVLNFGKMAHYKNGEYDGEWSFPGDHVDSAGNPIVGARGRFIEGHREGEWYDHGINSDLDTLLLHKFAGNFGSTVTGFVHAGTLTSHWKNGDLDGPFTIVNDNSHKVVLQTTFKAGQVDGPLTFIDPSDNSTKTIMFANGQFVSQQQPAPAPTTVTTTTAEVGPPAYSGN